MRKTTQAVWIAITFGLLGFAFTAVAMAGAAPPDPGDDTAGFLRLAYEAATSKRWSILVGYVLVGLAFVVRHYALGRFAWTQTRWGGFAIAVGLSLAGTFGLALGSGVEIGAALVLDAIATAMTAAGGWTWIQHALAKKPADAGGGN